MEQVGGSLSLSLNSFPSIDPSYQELGMPGLPGKLCSGQFPVVSSTFDCFLPVCFQNQLLSTNKGALCGRDVDSQFLYWVSTVDLMFFLS